jgi:hypothetical protein
LSGAKLTRNQELVAVLVAVCLPENTGLHRDVAVRVQYLPY